MADILISRKYVVCDDYICNVEEEGKNVGFQFKMRIPEYRGLPLALIGGIRLSVDKERYDEDVISITTEGQTFKWSELSTVRSVYWLFEEPAIITVRNGKGLEKGKHLIDAKVEVRISYMPPDMFVGEEKELELK